MASACVNNSIGVSPETFPSYGWLSPRLSLSREEDGTAPSKKKQSSSSAAKDETEISDPVDFEFRLEDPVTMLPADELFSDGKLVPLHLSTTKPSTVNIRSSGEATKSSCDISGMDPYLFSPKAPRCSSRWKELLGLKRLYQNHNKTTTSSSLLSSSSSSQNNPPKSSLKHFLHRNSKSSTSSTSSSDSSLNLPLLKDSDCESVSISSSRLSLSSSSSGHEHDDLPRLSLDSDKPSLNPNPFANPPRMRMVKPRAPSDGCNHHHSQATGTRVGRSPMRREQQQPQQTTSRGVSVDSPRMNSSGKIVFQSLERSSSSPSSFNGGPRYKHRGMERSYSANVRVTPVLNVPVCSLRGSSKSGSVFGFGQLFSSPQKNGNGNGGRQHQYQHQQQHQQSHGRNRSDRI